MKHFAIILIAATAATILSTAGQAGEDAIATGDELDRDTLCATKEKVGSGGRQVDGPKCTVSQAGAG